MIFIFLPPWFFVTKIKFSDEKFFYRSFNQHWDKRQFGRADLRVSQKAARQRHPTMPDAQVLF
jgi:hypothetical protein